MRKKAGVILDGVHSKLFDAALLIEPIMVKHGQECVITSGRDSVHGRNSRHYIGMALDFRTRDLNPNDYVKIADKVRKVLGEQYFSQVESNHLHVQWNGKAESW